jgi:hypothetical protein
LDANVLFPASYRSDAGLRKLWRPAGVRIVTSAYAVEEACRNLSQPPQHRELDELLGCVEVVPTAAPTDHLLFSSVVELPNKDRPVLLAASVWGRRTSLPATFGTTWGLTAGREYKGF